ncbi:MAG: FadR family transcriptional regulator [Burkholderiales bacterium]|nr:FadR family transcriptional regulator [Burkholderiales bacterium]
MPPQTFHGHIRDRLGEAIVAGVHSEGSSLPPEPALCQALGVSRTVVREAVKSLAAKGLVSIGPKVGTRVRPAEQWNWFDPDVVAWQSRVGLTREFLQDVQELRRVVEPAAVRLAAERATPADIAELEAAYAGMRAAVHGQSGDYVTSDLRFHQTLLRAAHNRMMVQMSKALGALLRSSFEVSTAQPGRAAGSLPQHRAILDAVIARQPARAERASLALIDSAREDIEAALKSRGRRPPVPVVAPAASALPVRAAGRAPEPNTKRAPRATGAARGAVPRPVTR